jgi:hypothetical protein
MRCALHLGVKKVDFEAVSLGYVVPVSVEDDMAMNRTDALAATAADMLIEDFIDFLFPDAPSAGVSGILPGYPCKEG